MPVGIAISWPASSPRLAQLARTRRIPLWCYPRQVAVRGSSLALVDEKGRVQLTCVLKSISEQRPVLLATGNRGSGYELVAKADTMRLATNGELGRIRIRWRFAGQLRYFNPKTMRVVTTSGYDDGDHTDEIPFQPYRGLIHGLPRNAPEAQLLTRYTKWVGGPESCWEGERQLQDGCWIDLLNRTQYTLFEAKAKRDDRTVREAFGQLYDYRRGFPRSPRLAVLLPEKPRQRLLTFLKHFRVAAVWERQSGAFSDSVGGRLTRALRAEYRARAH